MLANAVDGVKVHAHGVELSLQRRVRHAVDEARRATALALRPQDRLDGLDAFGRLARPTQHVSVVECLLVPDKPARVVDHRHLTSLAPFGPVPLHHVSPDLLPDLIHAIIEPRMRPKVRIADGFPGPRARMEDELRRRAPHVQRADHLSAQDAPQVAVDATSHVVGREDGVVRLVVPVDRPKVLPPKDKWHLRIIVQSRV